jgi:hypothetical protein
LNFAWKAKRCHQNRYFEYSHGLKGNLEAACKSMEALGMDLCIFTEVKFKKDDYYTRSASGYEILATEAESAFKGGVAVAAVAAAAAAAVAVVVVAASDFDEFGYLSSLSVGLFLATNTSL